MRKWLGPLALLAAGLFTAAVYNDLPDRLPTHWNIAGEPDAWSSRLKGAVMLPLAALVLWIVLHVLPLLDPLRKNYEKFRPTYDNTINLIVMFLAAAHVFILGVALGWPLDITRALPISIGVLSILIGNVLPRARRNWLFGVRTPWTLSNDRVWERTHRMAGYLFVALGVAVLVAAALPFSFSATVAFVGMATVAAVAFVYSYVAWRQETER